MLCEKCQTREATVHSTICIARSSEEPKKTDLCQECFEATGFEGAADMPATIKAGCKYCGGEFHSGGLDLLAMLGGIRKMRVMCKPCADEYFRFIRRKLPNFGNPDRITEHTAGIAKCDFPSILATLEEHMKQYVIKRKSQENGN